MAEVSRTKVKIRGGHPWAV